MSVDTKNIRSSSVDQVQGAAPMSPRKGPIHRISDPLSETGVLRLLNEPLPPAPVAAPSKRPTSAQAPRDNDETTSLRLIAPPESSGPAPCARCGHALAAENTICPRCRTRVATSSKAWQAVYRAAARAFAAR